MNQTHEYTIDLIRKFEAMKPNDNKWWMIDADRIDRDAFLGVLRELIYIGLPFILSADNNRFKKIYEPVISSPEPPYNEYTSIAEMLDMNGIEVRNADGCKKYFRNGNCIAIESLNKKR